MSFRKTEKVSLIETCFWGKDAYGFLRNLSKASSLSKQKVEQFLQIKTSYTNFGPPVRRFQGRQSFSKYINEFS